MQNILIAGFGTMGSTHAQIIGGLKGAQVTAIFDVDRARATELARRIGETAPLYDDFDRALAEHPVDAVVICLPVTLHAEYILRSVKAGKHVFCEKPLAMEDRQCRKVAAAADRAGVHLMVGLCVRFWPEYQALEARIRSRTLGRLLSISFQRRGGRIPPQRLKFFTPDGAGVDTHLHDTDFIHHLFGRPKAVTSSGIRDTTGWPHVFSIYHFDKVAVTSDGGHGWPSPWEFFQAFQAVFEKGTIEYDSRHNPTLTITEGSRPRRALAFSRPTVPPSRNGVGTTTDMSAFYNEIVYFLRCLNTGRKPKIASGWQAADSMRTVLREIRSVETGRTVRL